jgi:DNA-binding NtrC family response regulator
MLKPDGHTRAYLAELNVDALAALPRLDTARFLLEAASRDAALRARLCAAVAAARRGQGASLPFAAANAEAEPVGTDAFIIGASPAMLEVFDRLRRYATVDSPVLITGESGTGKELAARAIHERSNRAGGPFVAINCAALPPSLVSSELFGHEKGAFTGATERRIGHLEMAHRGTLFLDEIGDLPLEIQGHLLRFLQDGQITRVGGRAPMPLDARIVAATHVPLVDAMAARRFREDLFYRLAVLTLEMPPLRERPGDIDLLATVFLRRIAAECGRSAQGFTAEALDALRAHPWPGNVRQMIAVLRRAIVMANEGPLTVADLALDPVAPRDKAPAPVPVSLETRGRPAPASPEERCQVLEALEASRQQVSQAARRLGVSRVTLYRMLERNGIELKR